LIEYSSTKRGAALLWLLTGLFALRVVGQALVAFLHVGFLPPMSAWYSGLVPYPVLLPAQLAMLGLMGKVNVDLTAGAGMFATPRARLGRGLRGFALIYFLAMVGRYVVTMTLQPEQRWLGGTIPIVFHWVLAAYVFVWGGLTMAPAARARRAIR
jgi:hypothetical protein